MTEFVSDEEMPELKKKMSHLLSLESGLTEKEIDFLDSLHEWTQNFTVKQANWLNKIYEKKA